jgi:presenilin 1
MSFVLILNLVQVLAIPLDYITMFFALWNLAIVGNVVIFWRGPLWVQQAYLVLMSSLMAFALNGLEQWTAWLLLGILAIWDLIAVLCPFGPLKLLIESSRNQNRELPGLLYSVTMIYFGVNNDGPFGDTSIPMEVLAQESQEARERQKQRQLTNETDKSAHSQAGLLSQGAPSSSNAVNPMSTEGNAGQHSDHPTDIHPNEANGEEAEQSGLKLGLGDFVFYSVLVSRTATSDWVTTISCIAAVLMGLNMTIFLLAIYRKALPALPISIAFGLLFYFVTFYTLVPYVNTMAYAGIII